MTALRKMGIAELEKLIAESKGEWEHLEFKKTADEVDTAEQVKEDAATARLEKHIAPHVRRHPEDEGVHYSDLFEQSRPFPDKPRRLLADWLPEYFFKTTNRTWRPPAIAQEHEQKTALVRPALCGGSSGSPMP